LYRQIHKKEETKKIIKDSGNFLLYTIPYHPRLNAIEQWFNQVKHYIKLDKPSTFIKLKESLSNSILKIKIVKSHQNINSQKFIKIKKTAFKIRNALKYYVFIYRQRKCKPFLFHKKSLQFFLEIRKSSFFVSSLVLVG